MRGLEIAVQEDTKELISFVSLSEEILELIQETLEKKVVDEVEEDEQSTLKSKIEEEPIIIEDEEIHVDDEDVVDYTDIQLEIAHYELDPAAAQAFYKQTVDYDELYAHMGNGKLLTGHDIEYQEGLYTSEHSAAIHSQKAEQVMAKIQQSLMLKSSEKISVKDKEAFAYWQEFNKVLLALYHSSNMMRTSEVNYGTINTMDASLAF